MHSVLIANRGEIAIRIARACADLSLRSVAVYSEDDFYSLHVQIADAAVALPGTGPAAYLDGEALIAAANTAGCDALHPGYGFLSENADFARLCAVAGICFVGPTPEILDIFGDKGRARSFAGKQGIPLIGGIPAPASLDDIAEFFASLDLGEAIMIKAVSGGGGRGMRVVRHIGELDDAYRRCGSEAKSAFGDEALYAEKFIEKARHIEVQVIGDGNSVAHLYDRDCSVQRRNQKLIEIAPAPQLAPEAREQILAAAVKLAKAAGYVGLGTVEFLVDADDSNKMSRFAFLEVNPRLQVEHTVTEVVTGIDLVQAQLRIAAGETLAALGLGEKDVPPSTGYALELRINLETVGPDGSAIPSAGTLSVYEPPSGPGIRVDGYGYAGYTTNPRFDPLLAKVIVQGPSYSSTIARAGRALADFRVAGVDTNIDFLRRLLTDPEFARGAVTTGFLAERAPFFEAMSLPRSRHPPIVARSHVESNLADLTPYGTTPVLAPMSGIVIELPVKEGDAVRTGDTLVVIEAMKMEHTVITPFSGRVRLVGARLGEVITVDSPIIFIEQMAGEEEQSTAVVDIDLIDIRPDLAALLARQQLTLDAARPQASEKRHARGLRTARENLADLLDADSFREYGALVVAAQRRRRSLDDLIANTPADGLVTGVGTINADRYGAERAQCVVMAYDATVLAGTQGWMNHKKTDRMLALCAELRVPLVLFGEGGGGRPGDTDIESHGLEVPTFHHMAKLSGRVPLVAIVAGRCFAGNAALVGCCDVVIATADANLGMGGPAMIEGGGLGVYAPEEIGPTAVQARNGVVDLVAADEAEAVALAKRYLSYFQGNNQEWVCDDQRKLRWLIPENRVRAYDVRTVIDTLADVGSILELRARFGVGIFTALVRIEGRPLGIVANNPLHLGGAIDGDAAGKASRFLELCDAFALPVVNLIDTPGFMVGPEIEEAAQVRRVSQMLVVAASCTVPMYNVVLRKAYGLGALGIGGGSFHTPHFTVAWPTGEVGGMNLDGAVRLAYKKELEAIGDPEARKLWFEEKLAEAYKSGKAENAAAYFQLDAVIDPADTRSWIAGAMASAGPAHPPAGLRRSLVSVW